MRGLRILLAIGLMFSVPSCISFHVGGGKASLSVDLADAARAIKERVGRGADGAADGERGETEFMFDKATGERLPRFGTK